MTPKEKADRQKYVPVHITLLLDDATRAVLQKTFDEFVKACNKLSVKLHAEAVKHNDFSICTTNDDHTKNLAWGAIQPALHDVYKYSVAQIVVNAYKEANEKNQLDSLNPIRFANNPKQGETDVYTIPLRVTNKATKKEKNNAKNNVVADFESKTCKLDLIDGMHYIPFLYPDWIPKPPDSWKLLQGMIKKAEEDWEVIISYGNPLFPYDYDKVVKYVGVDRGEVNVATTFSDANGSKRYSSDEYCKKVKSAVTKLERHRARLEKDYRVAWDMVTREPEGALFVLEDLQFKERIPGWSYRNFADWLSFFAALHHQYIDYCDPHNTSRICPHCGAIMKKRDLKGRFFVCPNPQCGYGKDEYVNDDENAAENICRRGEA